MSFLGENESGKGNYKGKCIYLLMLIKQLNIPFNAHQATE
jgi:hypothetical protein